MLRHKNVLLCLGASTLNLEELLIVTEWVTNGTLRNLLDNTSIDLTWYVSLLTEINIQANANVSGFSNSQRNGIYSLYASYTL
jgi:hypothetical protein